MRPKKKASPERQAQLRAEIQRDRDLKESSYRARALKLFPHVCGRCAREFEGKRMRELTVHHKDHDHNHNPPDGSNWELLCLYCHDNEHEKALDGRIATAGSESSDLPPSIFSQFEALDKLLPSAPEDKDKPQI